MAKIPVVILCGGQGTRIRDVSRDLPKPMLNIGEKPIVWHIMKTYAAHGFTDFVLCLGYQGWQIKDFFLNYEYKLSDWTLQLNKQKTLEFHTAVQEDWRITLAETGDESMTGHRIWRVKKYLEGADHFCVTYGDGVADVNIQQLVEQHVKSGLAGTITGVKVAGRFGELEQEDGKILSFNEKPAVTAGRINAGFMVFDAKRAWDYFDDNKDLVLEKGPLMQMTVAKQLGVFAHDGFWQCMDTYREYQMLNEMWSTGQPRWTRDW